MPFRENTLEDYLESFRNGSHDMNRMRQVARTDRGAMGEAARIFIAEVEQAEAERNWTDNYQKQFATLQQAERHHAEVIAESRRQARRTMWAAWAAIAISLAALIVSLRKPG